MPFAKRTVEPPPQCRRPKLSDGGDDDDDGEEEEEEGGGEEALLGDLCSASHVALSRSLRQLSELARHACSIFQELEDELLSGNRRLRALQERVGKMQRGAEALDPKREAVPVSNLDVESKLTQHYQAPWHQQRNVFLPSTRPPCVEELHRHAKQNLWALHRGQDQRQRASSRERRVTISISVAPPMPTYPSPRSLRRREHKSRSMRTFERKRSSSPIVCCHFTPWSRKAPPSDPDTEVVALGHRPKCPVPNIPSTLDKQTNWSKALPLPTPEERMKSESQAISSCVIPINVTGAGFDRDASVRCSLVHSQSVLQRRRKLRRRKTISGIPRRVQQEDSDESPVARERTVIVHNNPNFSLCQEELSISCRLNTKDSGCQTEDFLITAPSRRRIRAQRGQGVSASLSHSTGNITSLPDTSDKMFTAAAASRLRSRSLPREGGRLMDEGQDDSDDEELSPYEAEEFLPELGDKVLKDEEESTDDQTLPEHQLDKQHPGSPDHSWTERGRSRLPRKIDMGSCEISSSSDTFSSPIHSVSTTGVLGSQIDHKEDHQSSSGNWSGSSSTCPSQTSETIPPAASPPLTGSSHCDSELSLNTALHANEESTGFAIDPYQSDPPQIQAHRGSSFTSEATGLLVNSRTACDGEWNYLHHQHNKSCHQDFSPPRSRAERGGLDCPSFTSMTTYESFMDKSPSEKADSSSHYSIDAEGYYTSMHFDCGIKGSRNYIQNYAALNSESSQNVNIAPSMSGYNQSDYQGHTTLGRCCLSLKKPKVKPAPPKRSSSLKKTSGCADLADKNEPKINSGPHMQLSSREMILQLELSTSPNHPDLNDEPLEAWGLDSVGKTDSALFGPTDTHSFKDEGAVQSDYADIWLLNDLKSSDPYRSLSNSSTATGTTVIECIKSPESSESQTSQPGSRATTPSLPSVEGEFKLASPEKLASLASPSSGYSSQSETPTSSFPSAFFPGPLSPTSGKRKPKVPERKSSLSSSQHKASPRDGSTFKRDLELPVIPPTHLDLSVLHRVSKPSAHMDQTHKPHHTKHKTMTTTITTAPKSEALGAASLAITPSVLRSVQLRSVSKFGDKGLEQFSKDPSTKPKCALVTVVSPPTNNRSPESKKTMGHKSNNLSSQEYFETLFIQSDKPFVACQEEVPFKQEKYGPGPFWAMTAFRTVSDTVFTEGDSLRPHPHPEEQSVGNKLHTCTSELRCASDKASVEKVEQRRSASRPLFRSKSLEMDSIQPASEESSNTGSPPAQSSVAKMFDLSRSSSLDKVPVTACQSEMLQAYTISDKSSREEEEETSGVSTRSASQDSREETSPDTEHCFSKETTPTDSSVSPLYDEAKIEDDSVFLSPSKARTTEDLFAMIHRSKRKVLGRKDSGELTVRNRLSSVTPSTPSVTPVTPPSAPISPGTPTSSQRPPGPIYRCVKKSTTSNEEFKLLLLKKGSRADSSYRMSATEILKSPVTPKGDPTTEDLLHAEQFPSPFPKANTEGFSPKSFSLSASFRQGRSRIPPPANSSRYSARSRLYTAPMQAISEGETENSDGSPHDDRSSQGSS